MFEKYILDGFVTEEVVAELEKDKNSFNLVREMSFKYGLKVVRILKTDQPHNYGVKTFVMAYDNGFVAGMVWVEGFQKDITYNFRSPYYRKDRGRNNADKEIIHSKKLSSLMGTLKRQNIVISKENIFLQQHVEPIARGRQMMRNSYGSITKRHHFGEDEIHIMLEQILLGKNTDDLFKNKCKETLDKFIEQDKIKDIRDTDVARFFSNEFYYIGADEMNDLIIGTVRYVEDATVHKIPYEVIKPFKRVKNLDNYPEVLAPMTMLKVNKESAQFMANTVPRISDFLKDLDMIVCADNREDEYNFRWVMFPCQ